MICCMQMEKCWVDDLFLINLFIKHLNSCIHKTGICYNHKFIGPLTIDYNYICKYEHMYICIINIEYLPCISAHIQVPVIVGTSSKVQHLDLFIVVYSYEKLWLYAYFHAANIGCDIAIAIILSYFKPGAHRPQARACLVSWYPFVYAHWCMCVCVSTPEGITNKSCERHS